MFFKKSVASIKAFTLVEVVMAIAILGLVFGGIILSSVLLARRAEWTGYSLAAQALAIQQLEQARSAKWDILDTPAVNELTNLPSVIAATLDLPISGTNAVWATNYVTMKTVSIPSSPPCLVYMVRVDTVWPFRHGSELVYHTNTVANYFAPDR
jgi:prepilin-type N-terminal cleavage/methylation domain-containing protein